MVERKLVVNYRPIAELIPSAANARTHSDAQVAQISASIREFGWTNPVLIDPEGGIIAGHGRVMAARQLGMGEIPCIVLAGLTPAQRRAYMLADNKLALNAGWDDKLLASEILGLQEDEFDLSLVGFSDEEIKRLLALHDAAQGLTDPDAVPEVPTEPVSVLGDLWALGRHRLVCGDSTNADTVAKCLGGVEPHLMVTDPPYGVEYDANWRNEALGGKAGGRATGKVANDGLADWSEAWALFPGEVAYIWHAGNMAHVVAESLLKTGWGIRSQIIWAKSQFVIGRGHYHPHHEPCWYAVRDKSGATGHWQGDRKQSTLWQIDKPQKSETGHSTQKPVECMKRPIENNSSPGQAVYEPFSGSGTTIIAAEMTGRVCHAIELSPAYVDVAIQRWQQFTGKAATMDGVSFDDIAGARKEAA